MNKDCIFCKIASGEAPADVEYEDDKVLAFQNINPVADTHLLIIPKKHIETFLDLNQQDNEIFINMKNVAQKLIQEKGLTDAYKLNFNGGSYQAVPHIHWHLLGGKLKKGGQT